MGRAVPPHRPARSSGGRVTQAIVQVAPFSVNDAGTALAPLQAPTKPVPVDTPGASIPFHDRFVTVTVGPLCEYWPDQSWVSVCPLAKVQTSVQPLIAA